MVLHRFFHLVTLRRPFPIFTSSLNTIFTFPCLLFNSFILLLMRKIILTHERPSPRMLRHIRDFYGLSAGELNLIRTAHRQTIKKTTQKSLKAHTFCEFTSDILLFLRSKYMAFVGKNWSQFLLEVCLFQSTILLEWCTYLH